MAKKHAKISEDDRRLASRHGMTFITEGEQERRQAFELLSSLRLALWESWNRGRTIESCDPRKTQRRRLFIRLLDLSVEKINVKQIHEGEACESE